MNKLEILEKLKDLEDTDEVIFTKKVGHWVPAPEDSWDGDVVYSTETVEVDDIVKDTRRSNTYRITQFYSIDDNFKVLCLGPHAKFVETDFMDEGGERVIHYPIITLNYKTISAKNSFKDRDSLIAYVNNFVGKSSGHKYNESEIIWGTGRE
ncbi:MAG: hypothetical protein VZR53_09460 [Prevotella sp.]|nr:hypothetical protein [Prevotella sp.]